jgi:DNA-directed RNA polymerase specialized sigma24 family protein
MTASKRQRLEAAAGAAALAVQKVSARMVELTGRRDRAIVALRADGVSLPQIARITGLSVTGVVKVLARSASADNTPE